MSLALVMTGGGARAAYQVGFLRHLARRSPGLEIPILTGVSAGAINATYLAARPGDLRERVEALCTLWSELEVHDVFRVGRFALLERVVSIGASMISGGRISRPTRGMVDTAPLRATLERALSSADGELPGVARRIEDGSLQALAISTLSYTTGQTITWVQGRDISNWERPNRRSAPCRVRLDHVLASASLPMFFPAVRIDSETRGEGWYGDGGVRLTAPLAPAVHLGATRILAISSRHPRSKVEAERPQITGYPPLAQVAGMLLNAIFLDQLDGDALAMERINELLAQCGAPVDDPLRPIELLVLRPSADLGALANRYEPRLPRAFRFLTRGFGTRRTRSNDLLSLVMFQPDYLRALIELGERDAEDRADELAAFLGPATATGRRSS